MTECAECGKHRKIMLTLEGTIKDVVLCSRCYVGGKPLMAGVTIQARIVPMEDEE